MKSKLLILCLLLGRMSCVEVQNTDICEATYGFKHLNDRNLCKVQFITVFGYVPTVGSYNLGMFGVPETWNQSAFASIAAMWPGMQAT